MTDPTVWDAKDYATVIALFFGPICAVGLTLWHQARSEKRAAKQRLFVLLMGHRKSIPISLEWTQSLNVIDVIYADHPKVVGLWHTLYDILDTKPLNEAKLQHARLEMLSAMANVLGYKALQQTDIDKFYVPDAHAQQANRIFEVQTELLRVLKASKNMSEGKDGS
jgi:hypothetical protein